MSSRKLSVEILHISLIILFLPFLILSRLMLELSEMIMKFIHLTTYYIFKNRLEDLGNKDEVKEFVDYVKGELNP